MLRNIKSLFVGLLAIAFMVGCDGPPRPGAPAKVQVAEVSTDASTIYVSSKATYDGAIAPNIKSECNIDTQVMEHIKIYASKNNINVIIDSNPKSSDKVLKISIIDAVSSGNAGIGHNKYVTISGKLYKGSKLESSFKASRRSGGGYFGGYKGSCSVLGSCAKTLGKDTAGWLVNPVNNAKLGDAYLIK